MGSRRDNQGARSLHCRGYDITRIGEKELRDAFSAFGRVADVYLPKDYYTKKVRGFAYIQFENESDADAARQKLDRTDVFRDQRTVNIMWAAGERKTPNDMIRLDIERDNPHARRARERAALSTRGPPGPQDADWHRDRDYRRDRDRDSRDRGPWPDSHPRREWDRDRHPDGWRDWDRGARGARGPASHQDRDRDRDRTRGYGYGGRLSSRTPPPLSRDRDYDRRPYDDRPEPLPSRRSDRDRDDRDYRASAQDRKRLRSRTPSPDRRRPDDYDHRRSRRHRSASRSPPPVRRRSGSPPPHHSLATEPADRSRAARSRSRTPTPRSRSPYRNGASGAQSSLDRPSGHDDWERRNHLPPINDDHVEDGGPAPRLRSVAPKLRSAPLSPDETTPATPDSR